MAELFSTFNCLTCGSACTLQTDGSFLCPCCGNIYRPKTGDGLLTDLRIAANLRQSARFAEAEQAYRDIVQKYKGQDLSDAYWGFFMCRQNLLFEMDGKGQVFPCFYRLKNIPCEDTDGYKGALWYADKYSPDKARVYRETAAFIDKARQDYAAISATPPYDIFICFKKTDSEGETTRGTQLAYDIYNRFSGKYNVFFSEVSLKNITVREYEPNIYYGLHTARVMLLICDKVSYLNTTWMRNEWCRFGAINRLDNDRKCILPVLMDGFNPDALPDELWHIQGLKDGRELFGDLTSYFDSFFNAGKTTDDSFGNKVSSIRSYCGAGEFERARAICDELSFEYASDYRVWTGYLRIVTDNYTNYQTGEIMKYEDIATRMGLDLKALDSDYADYLVKRQTARDGLARTSAKSVDSLISAFPKTLTPNDCYKVMQARKAYNNLSGLEKSYVTMSASLLAAESKLKISVKRPEPSADLFEETLHRPEQTPVKADNSAELFNQKRGIRHYVELCKTKPTKDFFMLDLVLVALLVLFSVLTAQFPDSYPTFLGWLFPLSGVICFVGVCVYSSRKRRRKKIDSGKYRKKQMPPESQRFIRGEGVIEALLPFLVFLVSLGEFIAYSAIM